MNVSHRGPQRRSIYLARRLARPAATLLLALALAACGDESDESRATPAAPAPEIAIYQLTRLEVTDHTPPEQWLASRQVGRDLAEDDMRVIGLKHMLDEAGRRFREYPRMIANRAVQLEEMLKEKNMPEPALHLIARLSGAVGQSRYVESFGATCQQYYNLRMQGLDQQEALKVLANEAHQGN